ncbi:transketolase [Branchiibius cervicis]|uniref:Transketolase n=1 Tax=Branchiibius cervicis TaxID=908252 RepID=A0ABW2AYM2_9MICO
MTQTARYDRSWHWDEGDDRALAVTRALSLDAIETAGSGHPGTALSLAPVTYLLYQKVMRHDPADPDWPGRDRFVLSCGHASLLQYTQLFLSGYAVTVEDLAHTRRWGSVTPGHPERGVTPGVEVSTGPLGSGFATAVGMALGARRERTLLDPEAPAGTSPFDHRVYVVCSDGDLEEGVSSEASSLAGTLGLGELVVFWDDNQISIDGPTDLSFREDVLARYEAYGWHVQRVEFRSLDGEYADRVDLLDEAVRRAEADPRPSMIAVATTIGWPAPHAAGTAAAHGAPLGPDEVAATKHVLGLDPAASFEVPQQVLRHTREALERGRTWHEDWDQVMQQWRDREPERAALYDRLRSRHLPDGWRDALPWVEQTESAAVATRAASGKTLTALGRGLPELWGGSADLADSTKAWMPGEAEFGTDGGAPGLDRRLIHFGIREFAMGLMLVGMSLSDLTRPFGGTYLVFSDYMRGAVRLAALQAAPVVFIWTHDSIGVGEDGPTHQPVEQIASLRTVPGLDVVRPGDANETVAAWAVLIERHSAPTGLILSRQALPVLTEGGADLIDQVRRGGYVLDSDEEPDVILIGTGSELQLVVRAAQRLRDEGVRCRVVSMPCVEWFLAQDESYRATVLPRRVAARVAVEAGVPDTWYRFVGTEGEVIGIDHFGASAPGPELFERFGVTTDHVVAAARTSLRRVAEQADRRSTRRG